MSFIPAGEIIGKDKHEVRTVVISDDPLLPDGEYRFLDLYCTDKKCDCRKVMFHVHHDGKLVAVANYGWETEAFYRKWLRCDLDDDMPKEMVGVKVDLMSPNLVSPNGIEILMRHLMNKEWQAKIKKYYILTRIKVNRSKKKYGKNFGDIFEG